MTTKELNTACRKLRYEYHRMSFADQNEGFEWMEKVCKPEFLRLYGADKTLEYLSADNIRGLLRINVANHFVPLHTFGIFCNIVK